MDNFSVLSEIYGAVWIILMPAAAILLICKIIAKRKGREKLAERFRRIGLRCAVIAGAAMLLSAISIMCGISEYYAKGH